MPKFTKKPVKKKVNRAHIYIPEELYNVSERTLYRYRNEQKRNQNSNAAMEITSEWKMLTCTFICLLVNRSGTQ